VLLGDREFCSKHLATWLLEIGWGYCLRIEKSTYIHLDKQESVTFNQLAAHPGISVFIQGVNITKTAHKFPFNVAVHYLDANIMDYRLLKDGLSYWSLD
jgi:hypothetical protein